jgi:hypothetical protein
LPKKNKFESRRKEKAMKGGRWEAKGGRWEVVDGQMGIGK